MKLKLSRKQAKKSASEWIQLFFPVYSAASWLEMHNHLERSLKKSNKKWDHSSPNKTTTLCQFYQRRNNNCLDFSFFSKWSPI